MRRIAVMLAIAVAAFAGGCDSAPSPAEAPVRSWETVEDLPQPIAVFERVFWEPLDTVSLRRWIRVSGEVRGKNVLEIGAGTGLLSLCALQAGAVKVVATDVNREAVANTRFNAARFGFEQRIDVRLVDISERSAYSVLHEGETFDLVISNPPWVDRSPQTIEDYALYDQGFFLLETLLDGLAAHLNPGGKAMLAYGSAVGIRALQQIASRKNLNTAVLDDRNLDELDEEFLPGMLIEVRPRQ